MFVIDAAYYVVKEFYAQKIMMSSISVKTFLPLTDGVDLKVDLDVVMKRKVFAVDFIV